MANCCICGKKIGILSSVQLIKNFSIERYSCGECSQLFEQAISGNAESEKSVREKMNQSANPDKYFIDYFNKRTKEAREQRLEQQKQTEMAQQAAIRSKEEKEKIAEISVTTCDLKQAYTIIGPVYVQLSNKGILSSTFSELVKQYQNEIADIKKSGLLSPYKADWGFLYGEWSVGQNDFEEAFYVAVQELKKRAFKLGADAIIGMRQDIDLDTTGFQHFYLQMYGTAVKFTDESD